MLGKSFRIGSLLLLPAVAVTVLALYLGGAVPYRVYVIHTGSMSPTIPSRSAVVVRDGRYHIGQVVTFHENGALVTHRLVAIHPDGTVDTKGDANRSIDPWHIRTREIVGGVVLAPHLVGFALVYVRSPLGAASLLLALLLVWQTFGLTKRREGREPAGG